MHAYFEIAAVGAKMFPLQGAGSPVDPYSIESQQNTRAISVFFIQRDERLVLILYAITKCSVDARFSNRMNFAI